MMLSERAQRGAPGWTNRTVECIKGEAHYLANFPAPYQATPAAPSSHSLCVCVVLFL